MLLPLTEVEMIDFEAQVEACKICCHVCFYKRVYAWALKENDRKKGWLEIKEEYLSRGR